MQVTPVIITYENRWLWAVALAGGLLISSVITGLSVGLPLGLACCKYDSTFTEYNGYKGPQISSLYFIITSSGTNTISLSKAVCNADSACAYFDCDSSGIVCYLYQASQVSEITTDSGFNVYLKNGYSLPNSG